MRVYLPATATVLRRLMDDGQLPGPHTTFAVTDQLRRFYAVSDAEADAEELEYAALLAAARASLRLLDIDPLAPRRRAVIAADVPDPAVTPMEDPHVEPGAVRVEADLGSEDAQFVVDQAEGHELAWYARQEMGSALELL